MIWVTNWVSLNVNWDLIILGMGRTHRTTGAFDDRLLTLMTDELIWFIKEVGDVFLFFNILREILWCSVTGNLTCRCLRRDAQSSYKF